MKGALDHLQGQFQKDSSKGMAASLAIKYKKLQKFRVKLQEEEAELERIKLQINELSRKTEHINIADYKKDPTGSYLNICVESYSSESPKLIYTIQSGDEFFTSTESSEGRFDKFSTKTCKKF